jgi:hypothetical protein
VPSPSGLTEAEVDLIVKMIEEKIAVSVVCKRFDISDTIFYRIRDGKHPVQVRRRNKINQLTGGAICPDCGRPFVAPCVVCKIRKNVATVGQFSPKKWDKPYMPQLAEESPETGSR